MHAFTHARPDDLELALDRFERIPDPTRPAGHGGAVAPAQPGSP
jgi:hypothetical protein